MSQLSDPAVTESPPEYDGIPTDDYPPGTFPAVGGWSVDAGHEDWTGWRHEDGTLLTRRWSRDDEGEPSGFELELDDETIFETGATDLAEARRETRRALELYEERDTVDAAAFEAARNEEFHTTLDAYAGGASP